MASFDFKARFVPLIRSNLKVQTIRSKKRCSVGDTMHLFTGLRTKRCERIANVQCMLTDYVHLEPSGITFGNKGNHPDCDGFAQLDGFRDFDDMLAWFQAAYATQHFIGTVHRWDPLAEPSSRRERR
jgi:hypothetical protein